MENVSDVILHITIAASFLVFIISFLIPQFYAVYSFLIKLISFIIFCASLFLEGYVTCKQNIEPELDKARKEIAQMEKESKEISKEIVYRYIVQQKIIKEKGDEIIKYVDTANDSDCNLHQSFVELHDSAAKNLVPDTTAVIDETASGVKLSEATKTIVENYTTYNQVAEQLRDLQFWVKKQNELNH